MAFNAIRENEILVKISEFPVHRKNCCFIYIIMCPCFDISPRASNTFNQVVEAKRFEGVSLCRKVC